MTRRILGLMSLMVGVGTAFVFGQTQPCTFFKERVKLSDSEIETIERGQVVTRVLESGDPKYGMLVFGAVYVNAPVRQFAAVVRDINKLRQNKVYLAVQAFSPNGAAPKISDFDHLELERKDVDQLERCKPGDCDIQIIRVEDLQKRVDWKSKDKGDQVNKVVRQRICEGMTLYMTGGLKAIGAYRDRTKPLNLYEATKSMIDLSYYLPKDKADGIYRHVVDYPEGKLAGAEDIFYWEKIDFGQEPTIRVNHVTVFPQGVGAVKLLVSNKQLYASRYMRVALQMFYCVPDTQNPNKRGFFLIEMNDSRLPDFGGIKLGVVRKIATGKAVDGTRDTLQMYQKWLTAN